MADPDNLSNCALLLASHGSATADPQDLPSERLAERVRNLNIFARVETGFLEQHPEVRKTLDDFEQDCVFVVPVMACDGYVAGTKLPKRLGLTGAITERLGPNGRQKVILTAPLGTDEGVAKLIFNQLNHAIQAHGLDANSTTALIVGHGSMRSPASKEQTETWVQDIKTMGFEPALEAAFLEEPPKIDNWRELAEGRDVLVIAVMISDGHHATIDVPKALGIEPDDAFQQALSQGIAGPFARDKQRVFVLPPLGLAPELAQRVVSIVEKSAIS
ncbi:MAG: hypothetical protein KAI73_03590 [Rhodospirillaceae bacterium]|nr:hypothetical protein [Rhodospirillaceae bacterium]